MVRVTRSSSKSNSADVSSTAAATAASTNSDDGDIEPGIVAPPRPKSKRVSSKRGRGSATVSRGGVGSRSRKSRVQEEEEEEQNSPEEDNEEDAIAPPTSASLNESSRFEFEKTNASADMSEVTQNEPVFKRPALPKKAPAVKFPRGRENQQQRASTIQNENRQKKGPAAKKTPPVSQASVLSDTQNSSQNTSRMSSTSKRLASVDMKQKKLIWDFLLNIMVESQHANATGRKSLYRKLQKQFYQESSPEQVNDRQKYFAQSLWRISLLPFRQPYSPPIERTLKFLHIVFSTCGTDEDRKEAGFAIETYPMFFYILKLFHQSHMDNRQLVRLRVMEAANEILQKHSKHPILINHKSILKDIQTDLSVRVRDKYAPIRVLSVTMLKYFTDDKSVIKDLKYYARFDPSADVRRAAICSLKDVLSTKSSFFYEHAFDPSDIVRMEAFSCLASRSMMNLNTEKQEKVLYWGLTQETKVKRCVVEKLLEAWFTECGKKPLELLTRLAIASKPKVAYTVLTHLYPNDFTQTFDAIDRSFLNEQNLIPLDQMSLEAVIFWIFLIKKFGKLRFHAERLLPAADAMIPYIRSIIQGIHAEHINFEIEDREEDVTLLMCLGYILPLCLMIGLEEGNRRNFEQILTEILLDPLLDETPVVFSAIDMMKKIVEPHMYGEKMTSIFQEVFEPSDPTMTEKTPATSRHASVLTRNNTSKAGEKMEVDHSPIRDREKTPDPPPTPVLTEQEITQLKDKVCELAMQRIRLGEQKQKAIGTSNFLEAHRLQEMIDAIMKQESEIRVKIQTPQTSYAEVSGSSRSRSLPLQRSEPNSALRDGLPRKSIAHDTSRFENFEAGTSHRSRIANQDEVDRDEIPLSQATTTMTENQIVISEQNKLKGLVMLTRFLSLHPKLTPFVRELYENHILHCIVDSDSRVRMSTLQLLCMIGLIERDERRKIMAFMLRALDADTDYCVKSSAFKGAVDLLLKYNFEDFRCKGEEDRYYVAELPRAYNDPRSTVAELEEMFIIALDKFASPAYGLQTPEAVGDKVLGMIKLLQISRIVSEAVISELLCMWSDKQYYGSAVPFNIGIWLPTYTKIALSNAKLIGKALLMSVKRVLGAQDDKENALCDADFTKMIDFVIPYISPNYLDTKDGDTVHEELAVAIFNDILKCPKWTGNSSLVKVTSKLQITKEQTARSISENISNILLKISAFPQTATVNTLKLSLKAASKRIHKQFEGLGDIPESGRALNNSGSSEGGQPATFSDSDDDELSIISNNLPVPDGKVEESEESENEDNVVDEIEENLVNNGENNDTEEDDDDDGSSV